MLSACRNSTILPLFLHMSLNSLDLAGVRLLSPRGSQILPKQMQVSLNRADDATELKEELIEDRVRYVVPFPVDQ